MPERRVSLVVDSHQSTKEEVETRVSQGSPVSPVLFVIYLGWVFKEVENEVEECVAMLFADQCGWLLVAESVEQLGEQLERAGFKAVK